jgi:hypothetical protein
MLLRDTETTLRIAENMTWKGKHPIVSRVTKIYEKGVKLSRKAMAAYEERIKRMPGLKDYFVDIDPSPIVGCLFFAMYLNYPVVGSPNSLIFSACKMQEL